MIGRQGSQGPVVRPALWVCPKSRTSGQTLSWRDFGGLGPYCHLAEGEGKA